MTYNFVNRRFFFVATLAAVVILLFVFLYSRGATQRTGVTFISVPFNISVSYNDKMVNVDGSLSKGSILPLKPGKYVFVVSAEGFASTIKEVTVKEGVVSRVGVSLNPVSEAAKKEVVNEKYKQNSSFIADQEFEDGTRLLSEKNPAVFNKLPILSKWYKVTPCQAYREESIKNQKIGICIDIYKTYDKVFLSNILADLSREGIDVESHDILVNNKRYPNKNERESGQDFQIPED